jgi:hypothetical protein
MKRETRLLFDKAVDSLILSIEHFNRPWDRGREEVVLILLDRSFELLLKAAIVHKGGKIRDSRAKETIGHDKCVRKCLTEAPVKCLTEDQALTIQIVNSLRDAAQHYLLEISEQQLYLYAQAGVTLFASLLASVFESKLTDFLPERVLPISTSPPRELDTLMSAEFAELKRMVAPGSRKRLLARARVRALAIVEASLQGERSQPSKGELDRVLKAVADNKSWRDVFPGVATLNLDTSGTGLSVSLKITKSEGEPITLVPEGTPGATVVAVKRVNELDYYSLGLQQLSEKLGITRPRALALVKHAKIQNDIELYKEIKLGKVTYKRYSAKAVEVLKASLVEVNMDEVWQRHKPPSARNR